MLMACLACLGSVQAQEKLYPNAFPLEDVQACTGFECGSSAAV